MLQLDSTNTTAFGAAPATPEPNPPSGAAIGASCFGTLVSRSTRAGLSGRSAPWKKLGLGVVLAFTLKGIVTTSILVLVLLGLAP